MQCLFYGIAKGTGNFPCFLFRVTFDSIYHHHLTAFKVEKQKKTWPQTAMITASHAYLVTRSKNIKNGMFSVATPYFSTKGTAQNDCPSMAANVQSERSEATMPKQKTRQWGVNFKNNNNKKILVFSGAVKDGSDTKLVWGKYRGDTFETCFSQ